MLKLKLQCFGHLMQRAGSLEKMLMLGKTRGRRRRGRHTMRRSDGITAQIDMSLSKLREVAKDREAWCAAGHGVEKCQTRLTTEQGQQHHFSGFLCTVGTMAICPSTFCVAPACQRRLPPVCYAGAPHTRGSHHGWRKAAGGL